MQRKRNAPAILTLGLFFELYGQVQRKGQVLTCIRTGTRTQNLGPSLQNILRFILRLSEVYRKVDVTLATLKRAATNFAAW